MFHCTLFSMQESGYSLSRKLLEMSFEGGKYLKRIILNDLEVRLYRDYQPRHGLEYATSAGMSLMIMETLRDGKLAEKIPEDFQALRDSTPEKVLNFHFPQLTGSMKSCRVNPVIFRNWERVRILPDVFFGRWKGA